MSYHVRVESTVTVVNKEEWDAIATSPFTSHAFVKIVEQINTINITPRYIVVYDGAELISFATAYIQGDAEYYTLEQSVYGGHYRKIRKLLPRLNPCLLCHSPLGNACSTTEISKTARNPETVFQLIVDTLRVQAEKEGLSQYGFLNVKEEDALLRRILLKNRFASSFSNFEVLLNTRHNNFESYLKSLSKRRRGMVRREIRRFDNQNLTTTIARNPGENGPTITRLFNDNFYKYQGKKSNFSLKILEGLCAEMAANCGLIIDRSKDNIVSCSMYLTWRNEMNMFKVGQVTNTAFDSCSFFNTAVYQPIRIAIENKLEQIGFGTGAYQYKLLRGAEVQPMYLFIKNTSPLENAMLRYLFKTLSKLKFKKHYEQVKYFL